MPEIDYAKVMADLDGLENTEARTKYIVDNNLVDWFVSGLAEARVECDILRSRLGDESLSSLSPEEHELIAGFEHHSKAEVIRSLVLATELQTLSIQLLTTLCDDNATGAQRNKARSAGRQFIANVRRFSNPETAKPESVETEAK